MRVLVAGEADDVLLLIRDSLRAKGMTQKQMARHIGFTEKHISQVLTGKCGTTLTVIFQMLEYADIGVAMMPGKTRTDSGSL